MKTFANGLVGLVLAGLITLLIRNANVSPAPDVSSSKVRVADIVSTDLVHVTEARLSLAAQDMESAREISLGRSNLKMSPDTREFGGVIKT